MKVRISNYHKLISNFIKKSELADDKSLFKLSSKYYSLAQKLYKFATSELDESIERNKNTIRANNRKAFEELLLIPEAAQHRIDNKNIILSHKDEILHLFDSLEYPYDIHFGETNLESVRTNLYEMFLFALFLFKKDVPADLALVIALRRELLGKQIFGEKSEQYPFFRNNEFVEDKYIQGFRMMNDIWLDYYRKSHETGYNYADTDELYIDAFVKFLESRKELYGFINDRRMEFRTPTLLLDIYLNLYRNIEVPNLTANRKEFLDLMYADSRSDDQINTNDFSNFNFDFEYFTSALNFNYIFGKNSISFLNQCHEQSAGNSLCDIPHLVDNELALYDLEYSPNLSQFILGNYFKVNVRKAVEDWVKKKLPDNEQQDLNKIKYLADQIMDPANEDIGVDMFNTIIKKKDCVKDATIKLRTSISLIATNWKRKIRLNDEEKIVRDIANRPIEQLNKIIKQDITAHDIGIQNIRNWKLFNAMNEYQENDIKKFLKVQYHTEYSKESDWYQELCKHKVENESYIGRLLPKKDLRFPFVGAITGCCQKVNGAGERAFENTFEENSGVFIVTDKKDKIVAQSYVWINDFTISLDSIESQHENFNLNDFKDIYDKACEQIFSKYFDVVLCGSNNTNTSLTNQDDRFIPLDLYPNTDPQTYTYDTSGGRSVMWSDPSSSFPFITVFQKAKNFLNEPYDEDEIEFLQNNLKLAVKICNDLVDIYINQVEQDLNTDNVLRFFANMTSMQTSSYDDIPFVYLCKILRGFPYDFDRNMNEKQFHISLNKWLFDGGLEYIKLHGSDEQLDSEFEMITILSETFDVTNLFKLQKLLYYDKNQIDRYEDFADLYNKIEQPYKNQIIDSLTKQFSFRDLMQKVNITKSDDLFQKFSGNNFKFLPLFISKYLQIGKFNVQDMKIALDIDIFGEFPWFSDENDQIIKPKDLLIENGILDYLFEWDENFDFVFPDSSALSNIRYAIENKDFDKSKITNFAEKFIQTLISTNVYYDEDSDDINHKMGYNIKSFLAKGYYTPNYNDKEIQSILRKYDINFRGLNAKVNRIYLSNIKPFEFSEDVLEDTINLIIDTKADSSKTDALHHIILFKLTKKIIVDVENSEYLTFEFINRLNNDKISFEIKSEDILNFISNYLSDTIIKELMIEYKNEKYTNGKDLNRYFQFNNFILWRIRSKFFNFQKLPVPSDSILSIINKKISEYFEWAKRVFNVFDENTKDVIQHAMDNTILQNTTPESPNEPTISPEPISEPTPEESTEQSPEPILENEEQRNTNSSSRKNIKYSIKRKYYAH